MNSEMDISKNQRRSTGGEGLFMDLQDIYEPQSLDYFFDVSNRHKCRNPMTTLKFLFAHAHTKLAFLDPWYRTSLSHFYSETQLLQPRLTWIFQQLLILAPLCLHSFRQRKKKRIEKCGSVSEAHSSNMAKVKMAKNVSTCKCEFVLPFSMKKIVPFELPLAMFTS